MAGARKVGHRTAVGRGNLGQCCGCLAPWRNGQRMTAVMTAGSDSVAWFCDECIRKMTPTPYGVVLEKQGSFEF